MRTCLACLTVLSLSAACGLYPEPVAAFSEDLCWESNGSGVVACTPLPPECEPAGTVSPACTARATALFAAASGYAHARSALHADATHLLAQAVGFAADDAYWIAAYDQAVDLGSYEPVDRHAVPVGGGALATATIDGLVRTNLGDGGVFFHFIAPRAPRSGDPQPVDGLHPDLDDAGTEGFLVHLRAWALEGSGTARPACADGLSSDTGSDFALGLSCFLRGSGQPAQIDASISTFGVQSVSFQVATGSQLLLSAGQPGGPLYAESFDALVGGGATRSANARLGIYLHALGDRISHHVCTDRTLLTGPTGPLRNFSVAMDNSDCTQGLHALRHVWEIGVDQSLLEAPHRTLRAGLESIYDELLAFAQLRGVARPQASETGYRNAWLAGLEADLSIIDGSERLDALSLRACAAGWPAFPGSEVCLFRNGFE